MATTITTTKFRADQVGSLLRPPEVLEAHEAFAQQRISQDRLREIEDRAIMTALDLQKQVGIDVFSDGEYRRGNWAGDFSASVSGYVPAEVPIRFEWHLADGIAPGEASASRNAVAQTPQMSGMVIGQKLRQHQP